MVHNGYVEFGVQTNEKNAVVIVIATTENGR